MNLESVIRVLETASVPYALIGGVALAARGAGRSTIDLDLLTTNRSVLRRDFWTSFASPIDVRVGDPDDPLAGVVRISGEEPIDVVVGKYRWQSEVVGRAQPVEIFGVTIPVARTEDLILLKLFAGGPRDLEDVRQILRLGNREQLVAGVAAHLGDLPDEMRSRWRALAN
jgi:predicted nucleotidyltransferase